MQHVEGNGVVVMNFPLPNNLHASCRSFWVYSKEEEVARWEMRRLFRLMGDVSNLA